MLEHCSDGMAIPGASLTVVEDDESDKESVDKGSFSFKMMQGELLKRVEFKKGQLRT